jgi:hypothetical protein
MVIKHIQSAAARLNVPIMGIHPVVFAANRRFLPTLNHEIYWSLNIGGGSLSFSAATSQLPDE